MLVSSLVLMGLIYPETCPRELHWSNWRGSVRMEPSGRGFVLGAVSSAAYTSRKDIVFSMLPS